MEEKQLKHFSHEEHPLILSQLREKKDDGIDQKVVVCYGCEDQILDSAAYCCSRCDFFLHKRCAELPRQITHPMHPQHPLVLFGHSPYFPSGNSYCDACGRCGWKFFTYHCSMCKFDVDVFCANLDREINPHSHDHPLIPLTRPATFDCDACCKVAEDSSSYLCTVCQFWIHQKCTLLPKTVKHKGHNHPLLLAYSLPSDYRRFPQFCSVCRQRVHTSRWVYYCGLCRYFVHITCVVISQKDEEQLSEDIDSSTSGEQLDQNVVKLPSSYAAQELMARFLLKEDHEISSGSDDSSKVNIIPEKIFLDSHEKHPLILLSGNVQNLDEINKSTSDDDHQIQEEAKGSLLVCDRCIEPICSSSDDLHCCNYYYACVECGYFVHITCSNLPHELQVPKHPEHPLSLTYNPRKVGLFVCDGCRWRPNGAYYNCKLCRYPIICIKCAGANMITGTIKHEGHKKHLLTQTQSSDRIFCTACGFMVSSGFACEDCYFYLCYACVLLPPKTTQRWDKHPLFLRHPPYFEHPEEFYCVLCEREINPNNWMYHCHECDYSLHLRCVPQVGLFKYVKFGRSLNVNNHSHPLTHVLEAKYKSFCGSCNESLDWEEAFECDSCRFYLCPGCAYTRELPSDVTIND